MYVSCPYGGGTTGWLSSGGFYTGYGYGSNPYSSFVYHAGF